MNVALGDLVLDKSMASLDDPTLGSGDLRVVIGVDVKESCVFAAIWSQDGPQEFRRITFSDVVHASSYEHYTGGFTTRETVATEIPSVNEKATQ